MGALAGRTGSGHARSGSAGAAVICSRQHTKWITSRSSRTGGATRTRTLRHCAQTATRRRPRPTGPRGMRSGSGPESGSRRDPSGCPCLVVPKNGRTFQIDAGRSARVSGVEGLARCSGAAGRAAGWPLRDPRLVLRSFCAVLGQPLQVSLRLMFSATNRRLMLRKNGCQGVDAIKAIRPPPACHTGTTVPARPALDAYSCRRAACSACYWCVRCPKDWFIGTMIMSWPCSWMCATSRFGIVSLLWRPSQVGWPGLPIGVFRLIACPWADRGPGRSCTCP